VKEWTEGVYILAYHKATKEIVFEGRERLFGNTNSENKT